MEVLMFLGIGFFIWAETQGNDAKSRPAPKGLSNAQRDRVVVAGSRIPLASVRFASDTDKDAAFAEFIKWARREAEVQGRSFDSIRGKNDYQKARAVFQKSRKWRVLRRKALSRHDRCLRCGNRDNLTVDHVIPAVIRPDKIDAESNLQTLCWPCNSWKHMQAIDFRC